MFMVLLIFALGNTNIGATKPIFLDFGSPTYFACNNDLCGAVLTNLLGDVFLRFLPHLSLEEGI